MMKKILSISLVLVLLSSSLLAGQTDDLSSDYKLVAQKILEAEKLKSQYEALTEAKKDEIFWLRIQNTALFLIVGYMAVNR